MILIMGDSHGNYESIIHKLKIKDIEDSYIIHVGDFMDFDGDSEYIMERFLFLNEKLKERNVILYAIRGNHDNPSYYNSTFHFSNLKLMSDYSILELYDKRFLLIGGAISIDRNSRIKNNLLMNTFKEYWENEGVVFDKFKISDLKDINYLITHDSPIDSYPIDIFKTNDECLRSDIIFNRTILKEIYDKLSLNNNILHWWHGHYHKSNVIKYSNDTIITSLKIDEIVQVT